MTKQRSQKEHHYDNAEPQPFRSPASKTSWAVASIVSASRSSTGADTGEGLGRRGRGRPQPVAEDPEPLVHDPEDEVVLVLEVPVDGRGRVPDALRDLPEREGLVAALEQQPAGRAEDRVAE